jgi:holo-[acyl-carrier protein] synthase
MPILAIGTDIAEIERFHETRISARFLHSVFTPTELAYCMGRARPEQHLAVRFAAKEAAAKALGAATGFVSVFQIEVVRLNHGAPVLRLIGGRHGEPAPELPPGARLHVSLSHSDRYAVATVILEGSE